MTTDWSSHFSDRTHRMEASAIRELLKVVARPEVISFAGGIPASESLPAKEVLEACERILTTKATVALQYGPTEGYDPLREQIADMYRARGVQATKDNVILTTGSQQGLDLIGKIFINEDDAVLVEMPTYVGALQAWRMFAPKFIGVPMDRNGLVIDELPKDTHARLMYLIPNFQNPTGISLSVERRAQVVEAAHKQKFLILEDDPYRELRYTGQDIPALVEVEGQMLGSKWDESGRVIHMGTFSKTLAPGLRLGWTLAPSEAIRMFTLAKQGTDLHTSTLSMLIAEDLIRNQVLEKKIPALRALYRDRRDAMLDALETEVGEHAKWTHPDGGLFLWLTLPGETDTPGLLAQALKKNVAFVPGDAFYWDHRGKDSLRLNFSMCSPETIREGVRRLGELITERQATVSGM
jgi:2-aminoadipate transaminase